MPFNRSMVFAGPTFLKGAFAQLIGLISRGVRFASVAAEWRTTCIRTTAAYGSMEPAAYVTV